MSISQLHTRARSKALDIQEFDQVFAHLQCLIRPDLQPARMDKSQLTTRLLLNQSSSIHSEFWIMNENKLKGRIGAWISPSDSAEGKLGLFEASSFDTTKILLEHAMDWLGARGVKKIYGPVDHSTWFDYRFRINWNDPLSYDFEPVNPPEYPFWWRELGFQISETYHSHGISELGLLAERLKADYTDAIQRGFQFRAFGSTSDIQRELCVIHEMSEAAFSSQFLFESIPFQMFQEIYLPRQTRAAKPLAYFVVSPEGQELGFTYNWIESDSLVMKTILLSPKARGLRLSNALLHVPTQEAHRMGINRGIAALIRDGLQSERYTREHELLWKHEYAVFSRSLE